MIFSLTRKLKYEKLLLTEFIYLEYAASSLNNPRLFPNTRALLPNTRHLSHLALHELIKVHRLAYKRLALTFLLPCLRQLVERVDLRPRSHHRAFLLAAAVVYHGLVGYHQLSLTGTVAIPVVERPYPEPPFKKESELLA